MEKVEKGEKTMDTRMNRSIKVWAVIVVTLIAIALLAAYWAVSTLPSSSFPERPIPGTIRFDFEFFYVAQTVVSTVNVALLCYLLTTYIDIYRKIRSPFTFGLILFSSVFLLRTLTANPLFMGIFGFIAFGLGPFALLPELFESLALIVLLYLSVKY
jgi:hypothetical protein